ncbi:3-oxoacyl-[acyl-carrier-protein] reductase FabG [bacterium BMS3Abin07]|nr:3-oxoacyl-[acyl-carrier-protein] reductase FabG [bacterium BMS3Abin07]GBE31832.1 3-oxoacyl-[acyl-carrier-protein] reductase FabG [bacterium BMS3Bbin05]HDL19883.1 3-oxoacyl-[acyl-carrier-protein] reductase [Nitrospirota bacterium]HDZ87903.1 3-oxoacyl-[acyl-carrier-protein] reductase [Nitrospirota bacterium]
MYSLDGKVALVTGGSKGIGKAIALALAHRGAKVCINYSSDDKAAENTLSELMEINGWGMKIKADVSDTDDVKRMVATIVKEADTVHILVNNAGIIRDSLLMLMKDDDWRRVIEINLNGVYNCSKAVLRPMIGEKWGRIINIVSPSAIMGRPGQTNYAASKGGIYSFTKSLAKELARLGITVNALSPGVIETELTKVLEEKVRREFIGMIPLGRFGNPSEVAHAACFLASGESQYITGVLISVDGGLT